MSRAYYSEASMADLLRDLWAGRFFVASGLAAGLLAGALLLTWAVPHYRATMIVAPVVSAAADEDGAVAEPTVPSLDFARYESILRGQAAATRLLARADLSAGLSAGRRWRGSRAPQTATAADLAAYMERCVTIEPVGGTSLRRVSYSHPDPEFAVAFLGYAHAAADAIIRDEIRARNAEETLHLETTLAAARNPEHRRTLTVLLNRSEQARMMLAMERPFAAAVTEPPAAGPRPHWPRPALVLPVSAMTGLFCGFALFCLRRRPA